MSCSYWKAEEAIDILFDWASESWKVRQKVGRRRQSVNGVLKESLVVELTYLHQERSGHSTSFHSLPYRFHFLSKPNLASSLLCLFACFVVVSFGLMMKGWRLSGVSRWLRACSTCRKEILVRMRLHLLNFHPQLQRLNGATTLVVFLKKSVTY